MRRYLIPRFGSTPIGKITVVAVQAWLADLHATKLSANSVAKAYRLMKAVMGDAVEAGLIARSPCRIRGAGTETAPEIHVATPAQVAALATAVGPRWEALVFTAAYSGLRWGELAGLRRCDVDLMQQTITVSRKLAEVNGELSFGPPKSAAGRRTVGIPSFVARSLAAHLNLYALPGDNGLVFPSTDGEPMRRSNFRRRVWEPATNAAGMDGFTFHALRHTAATLGAASGASLKALMSRMGHSSPRAALRYQHVIDGQDADIVRYLERFADTPHVPATDRDAPQSVGTQWARNAEGAVSPIGRTTPDQDLCGGDERTRTADPLLAKQVLYQLSYVPGLPRFYNGC